MIDFMSVWLQRLLGTSVYYRPYARASKAPSAMGPFARPSRFPKTLRGKAAVNLLDSGQPWIQMGQRSGLMTHTNGVHRRAYDSAGEISSTPRRYQVQTFEILLS